jgi:hypothetical protein
VRAIHAPAVAILGINNPELTQGTPEEQLQAMRNLQTVRAHRAVVETKTEIPRKQLEFGRYWIEDTDTRNLYTVFGGDPHYAPNVKFYFTTADSVPTMLEPADPPSLDELERRQERKKQRRLERENAAKERRRQRKGLKR